MAASITVNPRLKESIRDEPKQLLQPVSGYENEPLLSLEEACKPLEKILDKELQQNIIIAKLNSTEPSDGLSQDESASIHLYTMEWTVSGNNLYAVLNRTLRSADRRNLQPWFKYLKLFLTGFFKLPKTEHRTIWRGVPEDLSSLYLKGKKFTWWGVSSCSSSISVLQSPQYVGMSGTRTMFSIETNSGKLIRPHSYFKHEEEIVLPPGIYLEVIDKFSSADGLNIIHLREISPPYKMLADPFEISSLEKINEKHSLSEVMPMAVEEPSSEKEKLPITTQQKSPLYSDKKLACKGRACIKCGFCRDWYWQQNKQKKVYTKRNDATCTRRSYMAYPRVRFESDFYADRGSDYCHDHAGMADPYMCQCNTNKS